MGTSTGTDAPPNTINFRRNFFLSSLTTHHWSIQNNLYHGTTLHPQEHFKRTVTCLTLPLLNRSRIPQSTQPVKADLTEVLRANFRRLTVHQPEIKITS